MQKITIEGRLPSYNDLHTSWQKSWQIKKKAKEQVVLSALSMKPIREKVICSIHCYEPNNKRDCDNVMSGASKIILDALQDIGKLTNDSRRWVDLRFAPVKVDKNNPRIEVYFFDKTTDVKNADWALFWEDI